MKFKIRMLLIGESTWNTIQEDRPERPTDDWIKGELNPENNMA